MGAIVSEYVEDLFEEVQVEGPGTGPIPAWRCKACRMLFIPRREVGKVVASHECSGLTVKPPPADQEQFARRLKASRAASRPIKVHHSIKD